MPTQTKTSSEPQVERSVIKAPTGVATDAGRAIVIVGIEVTIAAEQNIERQP